MRKNGNFKRKSILKSPSSSALATCKKSATFDEANLVRTLHPKDKDYGHQPITEPKTPFEPHLPHTSTGSTKSTPVDAKVLHAKLVEVEKLQRLQPPLSSSSNTFATRRKQHYDEYKNIEMAKMLIAQDENDDDDAHKPPCDGAVGGKPK